MTRPGKQQTDVPPQERRSGNPGSTNPDPARPAPRTKEDQQQGDTPDPTRSTPQPNDPNRPSARQDTHPDAPNEETRGKGDPEGQTSDSPVGGEEGFGKPNDQGKPGSNKPGAGDSTGNPGGQEQADQKKTGQSGREHGPGSSQRPAQEQHSQAKPSENRDGGGSQPGKGESAGTSEQKGGSPSGQTGQGDGTRTGQPKGGGAARGGPAAGPAGQGGGAADVAQAEKANLEYNKKAANLVLKKLKEEIDSGQVDPELLKEFGWTEEQLKRFAQRLQEQLNRTDENLSPREAVRRQQLEEFLKGFRLRRGTSARDRSSPHVAPRRRPVPPEFRDAYEAYTRSLSRQATGSNPE